MVALRAAHGVVAGEGLVVAWVVSVDSVAVGVTVAAEEASALAVVSSD